MIIYYADRDLKRHDVKPQDEAIWCMADELGPDRNAINNDMMQDLDNNEGDDRAMKKRPAIGNGTCKRSYKL